MFTRCPVTANRTVLTDGRHAARARIAQGGCERVVARRHRHVGIWKRMKIS